MESQIPFRALGIDYGSRNVGIAVGQSLTQSASELTTLRHSERGTSQEVLFSALEKIVREWQPSVLVIGWPLNMDGSESDFCVEVKRFADKLCQRLDLPCVFWDERLSSREAKASTQAAGKKRQNSFRKNPVDAAAAKILLESWLQEQRS